MGANLSFTIHTGAGLIVPEIQDDGKVKVDMGQPVLRALDAPNKLPANKDEAVVKAGLEIDGATWNVTCVSMGNPHCVTFSKIGPKFEHHEVFPARTNTEFVQVFSRSHLKMRVWEGGAGATLACGTGACAVVVAAVLEGLSERRTAQLRTIGDRVEGGIQSHLHDRSREVVFYGSVLRAVNGTYRNG